MTMMNYDMGYFVGLMSDSVGLLFSRLVRFTTLTPNPGQM